MSIHRLPDTLDLHHEASAKLRAQGGRLVVQSALTFPTIHARYEDVADAIQAQGNPFNSRWSGDGQWPVAMDEKGLWTDTRWDVFLKLQKASDFDWRLPELTQSIRKGEIPLDLRCPALEGEETLVGRLMSIYGQLSGACPKNPGQNLTQNMVAFPLASTLKKIPRDQWVGIQDRGQTLLDLATKHQQWAVADLVWRAGVRWSQDHLDSGKALEDLIVGWMNLRQSIHEGWLKNNNRDLTGPDRIQWLDMWLTRYKELGAGVPNRPSLDRRHRSYEMRGSKVNPFLDTPVSFFCANLFAGAGTAVMGPKRMPDFAKSMLDQWLDFWADQDVDLTAEPIPKAVFISGGPAQFEDVFSKWPDVPQLREILISSRMDKALPAPASRAPKAPRL